MTLEAPERPGTLEALQTLQTLRGRHLGPTPRARPPLQTLRGRHLGPTPRARPPLQTLQTLQTLRGCSPARR